MAHNLQVGTTARYVSGEFDYVLTGGDALYYGDQPGVSVSSKIGTLAVGDRISRASNSYIVSAGTSYVTQQARSTPSNASVIDPADGATPTYDAVLKQFRMRSGPTEVNVFDYGAKGDGITDDTAAIQAAIDALPECTFTSVGHIDQDVPVSGGGVVILPDRNRSGTAATYLITASLKMESAQGLSGYGATIDYQGSGNAIERKTDAGVPYALHGLIFEGFTLVSSTLTGQNGISVDRICTSAFRDLQIIDFQANGLNFLTAQWNDIQNVRIFDCEGYGISLSGDPVAQGSNNNTFTRVWCEGNVLGGVYVESGICNTFTGCTFQFTGRCTTATNTRTDADLTVDVADPTLIPASGKIYIGEVGGAQTGELATYSSVAGSTLTLSARGVEGTTAQAIPSGTPINFMSGYGVHVYGGTVGAFNIGTTVTGSHLEGNSVHVFVEAGDPDTYTGQPSNVSLESNFFGVAWNVERFVVDQGVATSIFGGGSNNSADKAERAGSVSPIELHSIASSASIHGVMEIATVNMFCNEDGAEIAIPSTNMASEVTRGHTVMARGRAIYGRADDNSYLCRVVGLNGNAHAELGSSSYPSSVAGSAIGFYGATPVAQQTGVAVSAAGIHAALVALGLITA